MRIDSLQYIYMTPAYHYFILIDAYINKMNKNNSSSVNNYLTSSSLFRSNQKNRFVSSYVSHKNYFAKEE
jgi:hypothetical protein